MKRAFLLIVAVSIALLGVWSVAAAPPNFSGTWVLDKSKSEGLPQQMASAEVTLTVTQDDKQITSKQEVSGGQGMGAQASTYKLDGSETTQDLTGRLTGKATLKAKWLDGGKILELLSVAKVDFQGNEVTITTKEHWELAEDGKVLKIHRTRETPRGTQESKLVYTKK